MLVAGTHASHMDALLQGFVGMLSRCDGWMKSCEGVEGAGGERKAVDRWLISGAEGRSQLQAVTLCSQLGHRAR